MSQVCPIILPFETAFSQARENYDNRLCNKDIRVLLGNGFSQVYYGDFSYTTLFNAIKEEKDHAKVKLLFEHFGTSNFEAILRFLQDLQFASGVYEFDGGKIKVDYERLRDALADAIVKVHPDKTNSIPEANKTACHSFLNRFDDVFTVNYDLLLYWTILRDTKIIFGDYFNRDEDTPDEYCEYIEDGKGVEKHVFFLHGALHLFLKDGRTIKKVWGQQAPLIAQIKEEMAKGYYPMVVAEGDSESKIRQIKSNPYLNHALSKLQLCKGQLLTFGFSFSDQDKHIRDAISKNAGIKFVWIGIRGDFSKENNQRLLTVKEEMIVKRHQIVKETDKPGYGPLQVNFYDTEMMDIWGLNKERPEADS